MKCCLSLAVLMSAALGLAACSQTTGGTSPALGLVPDGGAAALTPIGTFAGQGLSSAAQKKAAEAEFRALEFGRTGIPVAWREGESRGEVTPGAPYQVNAANCRDYTHTVSIAGGPPLSGRGTACRQANGSWQTVM